MSLEHRAWRGGPFPVPRGWGGVVSLDPTSRDPQEGPCVGCRINPAIPKGQLCEFAEVILGPAAFGRPLVGVGPCQKLIEGEGTGGGV